jgi:hypothetical protein
MGSPFELVVNAGEWKEFLIPPNIIACFKLVAFTPIGLETESREVTLQSRVTYSYPTTSDVLHGPRETGTELSTLISSTGSKIRQPKKVTFLYVSDLKPSFTVTGGANARIEGVFLRDDDFKGSSSKRHTKEVSEDLVPSQRLSQQALKEDSTVIDVNPSEE